MSHPSILTYPCDHYFPKKLITSKVNVSVAVKVDIMKEIVGRFVFKIFWLTGSTITRSFGRRKYASDVSIFLS
jgi:hypothetical protein